MFIEHTTKLIFFSPKKRGRKPGSKNKKEKASDEIEGKHHGGKDVEAVLSVHALKDNSENKASKKPKKMTDTNDKKKAGRKHKDQ